MADIFAEYNNKDTKEPFSRNIIIFKRISPKRYFSLGSTVFFMVSKQQIYNIN